MAININTKLFAKAIIDAALGRGLVDESVINSICENENKKIILVSAMPRSGSTFLSNSIMNLTGLRYFRLCSAYSTNEHDLYLPSLFIATKVGCISQMHMKGTFHNVGLAKAFGIKPILLVRNIFDVIISLKNDLRKKQSSRHCLNGMDGYSFIWQDQYTKSYSDEKLIDMIIDLAVPWYVNYYASWYRLEQLKRIDVMWVRYEELMLNKFDRISEILKFTNMEMLPDLSNEVIDKILNSEYDTFNKSNKGRFGKGKEILTKEQQQKIIDKFSYYPNIPYLIFD